jgi:hypothetical protein
MKQCSYCGREYSDDVAVCDVDGQPVVADGSKPHKSRTSRKRYTNMDIGAAVVGILFIMFGVVSVMYPAESTMTPDGPGRYRSIIRSDKPVHVTKTGCQIYGAISIAFGAGVCCLVRYRCRQ